MTNWKGADKGIITIGVPSGQDVADAFYAIRKAGIVVLTGITPETELSIPIKPLDLTRFQKTIKGGIYGGSNPNADIPRQYAMYQAGQLKLDEFISNTYSLDDINQGYEDLLAGKNIRGGVAHQH